MVVEERELDGFVRSLASSVPLDGFMPSGKVILALSLLLRDANRENSIAEVEVNLQPLVLSEAIIFCS